MASAAPEAGGGGGGPPDLISECPVQPVDLVNSVQHPAVVTLQHAQLMPVDIVGDLPDAGGDEASPDVSEDHHDARWFSRGTVSNGAMSGETL